MAWHRIGDRQLSEPMMTSSLTHMSMCATIAWVKMNGKGLSWQYIIMYQPWWSCDVTKTFYEIIFVRMSYVSSQHGQLTHWGLQSNWQYGSIGSDNGLRPNRRQAIIRSNVAMLYWWIHASLDLSELTHCSLVMPYGNLELNQHWPR